jgi:hypothetical protein
MSSCAGPDGKIYLIGGVLISNNHPSSTMYEVAARRIGKNIKKKNMLTKRFGHSSMFLNGYIYVIGGFSHRDVPNEAPVTIASCEKFAVHENKWQYIASLNESRAFAGCVKIED